MNILNYLWLLLSLNMGDTDFQNFIGKHIKDFNIISGEIKQNADLNQYYIFSEEGHEFYGKTYHNITINTDDKDIIKGITIYIHGVIDKSFYDAFNDYYGLPSNILVVDFEKVVSEERVEEGLASSVKDHIFFFKEGNFEDNPRYLHWNKTNYQIGLSLRYDVKISEIKFTLPTD